MLIHVFMVSFPPGVPLGIMNEFYHTHTHTQKPRNILAEKLPSAKEQSSALGDIFIPRTQTCMVIIESLPMFKEAYRLTLGVTRGG